MNCPSSENSWECEANVPQEMIDSFKNGTGGLFEKLAEMTSETLIPDEQKWDAVSIIELDLTSHINIHPTNYGLLESSHVTPEKTVLQFKTSVIDQQGYTYIWPCLINMKVGFVLCRHILKLMFLVYVN